MISPPWTARQMLLLALCAGAAMLPKMARAASTPDTANPVADPRAVVTLGHTRFTVLTPQMIRMEWAADGRFEDHASLVFLNRRLPVAEFTAHVQHNHLVIQTSALTLNFNPSRPDEQLSASNLDIRLLVGQKEVHWRPGMPDIGNLLGTARTLDNPDRIKTIEPPLEPGLVSRSGWVLVDDSRRPLFDSADFSFAQGADSPWPWVIRRPAGDRQDWYFFGYGHDYKQTLRDFIQVAGRIPLPPRFAFGSWWSRYWAYSDQEFNDLVQQFHKNHVPLDVLVIDMEWHNTLGMHYDRQDASGNKLGWTGYTWDHNLFPAPERFLQTMHQQGLRVTLNMHPAAGVQPWEDRYPEMARAMGMDPAGKRYVPFDITSKKYASNYFNVLLHPLEQQGVDFWWLDWQQGETTPVPGLNPTWWLNYVHFTDQQREGKRPLLFHRWGGLGNHRYEIGFSGDTISDWAGLRFQPYFTANAANVGYAYWSHDIGGHIPGAVDPELYARWVQFGVFSPILRTHTTKSPDAERRIWTYPEPYSRVMRDAFHLRAELEPYLYTEARRTYDTGLAFLHPLYYEWPELPEAMSFRNEYMFGDSMFVAPVTDPVDPASSLATQRVWVPPGEWIEWQTGARHQGPAVLEEKVSLDQIPVYVREGTIVPLRKTDGSDTLNLVSFPLHAGQQSSYTLYEDSSEGEGYQTGEGAWTSIACERTGDATTIHIAPARGAYPGIATQRAWDVSLPAGWPPDSVLLNGRELPQDTGWTYDGNTLTTVIHIPQTPTSTPIKIVVRRSARTALEDSQLEAFAGSLTRLKFAYDALNQLWPAASPSLSLLHALQTGNRITQSPRRTNEELQNFHTEARQALEDTRQLLSEAERPPAATPVHLRAPLDAANQKRVVSVLTAAVMQLETIEAAR